MGTSQIPLSALSEGSIKARTCLPEGFSGQWGEARIYGGGDGDGVPRRMCFWAGTTGLAPTQELHVEIPRLFQHVSALRGWAGGAECLVACMKPWVLPLAPTDHQL